MDACLLAGAALRAELRDAVGDLDIHALSTDRLFKRGVDRVPLCTRGMGMLL